MFARSESYVGANGKRLGRSIGNGHSLKIKRRASLGTDVGKFNELGGVLLAGGIVVNFADA